MSFRYLDTHCHVHFSAYDADRADVLARLRDSGGAAILIGTSLANSRAAIALAEAEPNLWATAGLHPSYVTDPHHDGSEGAVDEHDVSFAALKALAESSPRVVAIGEAGLDVYRATPETKSEVLEKQQAVFLTHLDVAEALGLPVVIHCREALGELATLLHERQASGHRDRCVLHSFTGTWAEAEPLLELGCFIALNGIVTFPPRKGTPPEAWLGLVAKNVPADRLLLETDAPYLAPVPHRGERNEPAFALATADHLARMRGMGVEELLALTKANALRLFTRIPA